MQYVSSFERIFTRRGLEKGMEKGLLRGQALLLQRLLTRRFGALPEWVDARLNQALPVQLETWGDRVLDAQSLEEVFAPANDH